MIVTVFGVLVVLIGSVLLFRGSVLAMLVFVIGCSLLGGSATLILTALGNSSVPPANLAILFLALRCLLPDKAGASGLAPALGANVWLALFVLYGAAGAMILPRIFAGMLDVTPLRPIPGQGLYTQVPLMFSNQNVTVAFYMFSTLIAGVCATRAMAQATAWLTIARTAAVVGAVHATLGISGVVLASTPLAAFFAFFRNGFYAQLDHSFDGVARMTGIFPEAAVYSAYGVVWMVFLIELWLRGIETRYTGPAALLLSLALLGSTSSTAYLGIAAYGVLLGLRLLLGADTTTGNRRFVVAALGLVGFAVMLAVVAFLPRLGDELLKLGRLMTVDKLESASGAQRAFWAAQGYAAFFQSWGLGIGPGSFRSSSLLTAILGSTGVLGTLAFLLHLGRVFMPGRRSTWVIVADPRASVGAAASWTAVVMLIPASFSAPSPDRAGLGSCRRHGPGPALAAPTGARACPRSSFTLSRARHWPAPATVRAPIMNAPS
jgi:hypothetical protein